MGRGEVARSILFWLEAHWQGFVASTGGDAAVVQAARSTDVAAVVVPILFLILLSLGVGFAILYTKHRRLQSSFTAFANSHYSSRLGSAIFSSGDDLGKQPGVPGAQGQMNTTKWGRLSASLQGRRLSSAPTLEIFAFPCSLIKTPHSLWFYSPGP